MLLAIDVGNTDIKFGVWGEQDWLGTWRTPTQGLANVNALLDWLKENMSQAGLGKPITSIGCASVVPHFNTAIDELASKLTRGEAFFLTSETVAGLHVLYQPLRSLGADRIANVVGALAQYHPPVITVDFGSATTIDVASEDGFVGGAILPGLGLQREVLAVRTAQLPEVPLELPPNPIGNSTVFSLQSGIVLGHLAAAEGLLDKMQKQLGRPATVIATGGFSHLFIGATVAIHHFVPTLTLDGIRVATPLSA